MDHAEAELLRAIHGLEQRVTERIHKHTAVLEVNNQKIQDLKESVDRHRVILYGHDDGARLGLISRMHEIEKTETERKWTLRTVTTAFVGLASKFAWDFFSQM